MKRLLLIALSIALVLAAGCKPKPTATRLVTITEHPTHISITSEPIKEAE